MEEIQAFGICECENLSNEISREFAAAVVYASFFSGRSC